VANERDGPQQALGTSTTSRGPADDSNGNRRVQQQQQQAAELHQTLADEWLQAIKAPPELRQPKVFVFVRHGHSTWNEQSRIQGNTNESELTEIGRLQAVKARDALQGLQFDSCFSSPHTRARQTAEVVWQPWQDQQPELVPQYLHHLSEVDLGWFQGLRNEDIAASHPDLYRVWREEPECFVLDGKRPVLDAFRQARKAWADLLAAPGETHLVITHKSLLRALLCTALGLPPRQFRAIDLANGAVCMVRVNKRGDMMLSALNLTSHLLYDNVKYQLPILNKNDKLAAIGGIAAVPAYTAAGAAAAAVGIAPYQQS
jgi:serine/threonine-protein phosphatase PGAM5